MLAHKKQAKNRKLYKDGLAEIDFYTVGIIGSM